MELNHSGGSSGVAKAGLTTGIIGTALGAMNGGGGILGNLFGWGNNCGCGRGYGVGYGYDPVNRFELAQESALAAKDAEIALLRSNTYQDQKMLELYKYIDGKFSAYETEFCRLNTAFTHERDERICGDNAIVNYVNSTFYPKQFADVTVGTTNTAAAVYNPIPRSGCNCGR